ncbi:MAG: M56 family metallopeptidase [Lachnospiraceae bacterium]|nr:M56 family metallopeptidase [Lachnospiraceae bacterium]
MTPGFSTVQMTPNVLLINLAMLFFTTTLVGGIMTVLWQGIGKLLERVGFINITFELLKMAAFFYCFPMVYVFLKIFEKELGRGYLFGPTEIILSISKVFLLTYCLGILIMLAYILHATIKLKKKYADLFPCDKKTQEIFDDVLKALNERKNNRFSKLQLRQSYRASVPCITGILHPTIILPVVKYSEEELTYILMHEAMHYKQNDVLLKRVAILVCAFHFYNPLAWMLLVNIQKCSEYACDDKVCRHKRNIQEYFEVLMSVAAGERMHSRFASHLVEDRHELVKRANKVKKLYGKKCSKVSAAIILCGAFILSSMTVCVTTLVSAEQYILLKRKTVVEIEVEHIDYEEYAEIGDAEDIQVVEGEVERFHGCQYSINWKMDGKTQKITPIMKCNQNDLMPLSIDVVPNDVNIKMGIKDFSGKKCYVTGNGNVEKVFVVDDANDYCFFVENNSDAIITVTGGYLSPDE